MTDKIKKTEGPACACGRGDLYEEWLRNNEAAENKKDLSAGNESDTSFPSDNAEKMKKKLKKTYPKHK